MDWTSGKTTDRIAAAAALMAMGALLGGTAPAAAQRGPIPLQRDPVETKRFGEIGRAHV